MRPGVAEVGNCSQVSPASSERKMPRLVPTRSVSGFEGDCVSAWMASPLKVSASRHVAPPSFVLKNPPGSLWRCAAT
jgi:hypothetical protein